MVIVCSICCCLGIVNVFVKCFSLWVRFGYLNNERVQYVSNVSAGVAYAEGTTSTIKLRVVEPAERLRSCYRRLEQIEKSRLDIRTTHLNGCFWGVGHRGHRGNRGMTP